MPVTLLVTQAAMKHMIDLKTGGRIIVVESCHSVLASKNKVGYVAAKHAQVVFVKEGAEHNISSNLIGPVVLYYPPCSRKTNSRTG